MNRNATVCQALCLFPSASASKRSHVLFQVTCECSSPATHHRKDTSEDKQLRRNTPEKNPVPGIKPTPPHCQLEPILVCSPLLSSKTLKRICLSLGLSHCSLHHAQCSIIQRTSALLKGLHLRYWLHHFTTVCSGSSY